MNPRYSWRRRLATTARFGLVRAAGYPMSISIETTRRCCARCDFCRLWHTRDEDRLADYVDVVRKLKPVVVTLTGGEPLMRRDLEGIIGRLRSGCPLVFLNMVTNGWLLSLDRGLALWDAGLDQMVVSLDFLDERHDQMRGLPGLTRKILDVLPRLVAGGVDNLVVQTVLRADNLDCACDIARWAAARKIKVSFSAYTATKNGNTAYLLRAEQLKACARVIEQLLALKRETGAITSSDWYLQRIPEYFARGGIDGCSAGQRFLSVGPNGDVQACSESSTSCHYTEWSKHRWGRPACNQCWVPCRGEVEAPLDWARVKQAVALYCGRAEPRRERPAGEPMCEPTVE